MDPANQSQVKALTWRSALVSLLMVLLWTVGCCFMASYGAVHTQQMLMVLGFGAILTIFLLQAPRLFLGTLVVIWAGAFVLGRLGASPEDYARLSGGYLRALVVVLPLMGLAYWLHRKPLGHGELAVVYACVVIAIPWCISIKACIESSTANLFESQRSSEKQMYAWARELPWWGPTIKRRSAPPAGQAATTTTAPGSTAPISGEVTAPAAPGQELGPEDLATIEAVKGFTQGNGGKVPWRLWWRPMLYWVAMCLAMEGMLMGLLLMFRKRWIEHERLPFVWAYPALTLIRGTKESFSARRKWVLFGAGLAICLPAVILVSPSGEALSNWSVPPWATFSEGWRGGFDLTQYNLLPGTDLRLYWGPLVLAIFLLFPLDVLMTVALTYLGISIILPGLMRSFGLQVGPTLLGEFTKWGLRFGGCLGLLFWSVWFNRRTIWGYLRSLWGAAPADPESDDELPRWFIASIAVGGLVAFVALGTYATTLIQMVLLTGFTLIYAFAQVRQRVEGMPLTYDNNIGSHQMVSIQYSFLHDHYIWATAHGLPVTGSSWATHWMQWGFNGQLKTFGAQNMLLEAFKIAHELRVNARAVAKAILITMLLVAAVTPLLYVKLMYIYGFDNSYQGALSTWASFTQWSERGVSYGVHSTSKVFYVPDIGSWYDRHRNFFNMFYGVAIIGALFYLRREYPRFPVSPVGVVLAAEYWSRGYGMPFSADWVWFSYLLAGVAKGLVFRWLGVRSFREKIQPAIIIVLCGMIYGMMLYIFRNVALLQGSLK